MIKVRDCVTIQDNVRLSATGYSTYGNQIVLQIKDQVFIGYGSVLESNKYIELNRYCMVGPYCYISDSNHVHHLNNGLFSTLGGIYKSVIIKENCWIGDHSIILPGVTMNENSIVAANSTVLKDINKGSLNAGSPSIEKRINSDDNKK
jgi:acetyltransferase-like isoleucine patch superfamily enzyme